MNDYIADFRLFPTSIVFGFDDPNDHIDYIVDHAPIKKVEFTRPPAPWMKDPELMTSSNT